MMTFYYVSLFFMLYHPLVTSPHYDTPFYLHWAELTLSKTGHFYNELDKLKHVQRRAQKMTRDLQTMSYEESMKKLRQFRLEKTERRVIKYL